MLHRLLLVLAAAPLFVCAATPAAAQAPAEAKPAPASAKPAAAQPAKLVVGAEAPAFLPAKWLKGEPVSAFEKDKVYLVECWATWCGPCVAAIPHVNELHNKFKDKGLVVIGTNVSEDAEAKVAAFVAKKGDGMAYRVAFDGSPGNIAKAWLDAVGARGIPHAFVVREGKLLWHGHPAMLTEETVTAMIAGKYDGAAEVAKADARESAERTKLAAYRIARNEIMRLVREKDFAAALAKVEASEAVLAGTDPSDPHLLRGIISSGRGETAAALSHYNLAVNAAPTNPAAQFRIANALLNSGTARDNALALKCARFAAQKNCPPYVTFLLAQAEYASGDKEAALRRLDEIEANPGEGDKVFVEMVRASREAVKAGAAWPEMKFSRR